MIAANPHYSPSRISRFDLHGVPVELRCSVPTLRTAITQALDIFAVDPSATDAVTPTPITGIVQRFDLAALHRGLSTTAVPISCPDDLIQLYQDGNRYWIVDDRWGMAEVDLLKRQWRSWILPRPTVDPVRCVEMAILRPLAQLARGRGLHLLPAVSLARENQGFLLVTPLCLEPELRLLIGNGYRLISQRWTALLEQNDRLMMLHMPGFSERRGHPGAMPKRVDLNAEFPRAKQDRARCSHILLGVPGRRQKSSMRTLGNGEIAALFRQRWPMVELQPDRPPMQLLPRAAVTCKWAELHLSNQPVELPNLLLSRTQMPPVSMLKFTLFEQALRRKLESK